MSMNTAQDGNFQQPLTEAEFEQNSQFLILMVKLAYCYGVATDRLVNYFAWLPSSTLGLQGEISVSPPFLILGLWRPTDTQQHTFMVRLPAISYDMNKLAQIGELMNLFQKGQVPVVEAIARLKQIDALPAIYGRGMEALGYALCGASIAVLLSASWIDVFLSGILSLFVFAVVAQVSRMPRLTAGLEVFAALAAAIAANIVAHFVPGSNPNTVAPSAVIVLIPGLALTLGVGDLVAKSIMSGASRLIDGVVITVKLFIGVTLGAAIVTTLTKVPTPVAAPAMPLLAKLVAVVLLMAGLSFVFQVRPQERIAVIMAGLLAYGGVLLGGLMGLWQGSFIGAFILGMYAILFSLWGRRPVSVMMVTGIMILVPGIAAYFGLRTLDSSGIIGGLAAFWGVMIQIAAIIAGLVTATSLIPSDSSL